MATDVGLVELAMSNRQYSMVEHMLKAVPESHLNTLQFSERYKAFALAKWALYDNWITSEPQFILQTLYDYATSPNASVELPRGVVLQAAALLLSSKVTDKTKMKGKDSFGSLIEETFPSSAEFAEDKRQLLHLGAEFESPQRVVSAKSGDAVEFAVLISNVAKDIDDALPKPHVGAAVVEGDADEHLDLEDAEGETFSASELRAAFPGSWSDWSKLIRYELPEVRAFAQKQTVNPPAQKKSKKGESMQPAVTPPSLKTGVKSETPESLGKKKAGSSPVPGPAAQGAKQKKKKSSDMIGLSLSKRPEGGKKERRKWSEEEELCLVKGVRKYGAGFWREMLLDDRLSFNERTTVDLKDKWRNLEKKRAVYDQKIDKEDGKGSAKKSTKKSLNKKKKEEAADDNDDDDDDDDDDGGNNRDDLVEDIDESNTPTSSQKTLNARQMAELKRQKRIDGVDGPK